MLRLKNLLLQLLRLEIDTYSPQPLQELIFILLPQLTPELRDGILRTSCFKFLINCEETPNRASVENCSKRTPNRPTDYMQTIRRRSYSRPKSCSPHDPNLRGRMIRRLMILQPLLRKANHEHFFHDFIRH